MVYNMVYSQSTLGNVPVHGPVRGFGLKVNLHEGGEEQKGERKHGWMKGGR